MRQNDRNYEVFRLTLYNGDQINFAKDVFYKEKASLQSKFTDQIESIKKIKVSAKEYQRLVGEVPF